MISWKLDFGEGVPAAGYTGVDASTQLGPESVIGWVSNSGLEVRDRNAGDPILGRFVYGKGPAVLRVPVEPGRYNLRVIMGDKDYRGHILQLGLSESDHVFPALTADASEYAGLQATIDVSQSFLDLRFSSPIDNWVVNSVVLDPAVGHGFDEPVVFRGKFGDRTMTPPAPAKWRSKCRLTTASRTASASAIMNSRLL